MTVMDVLYREAKGQDLQAPHTWQLGNAAIKRPLWMPDDGPANAYGRFTLVGWEDGLHLDQEAALDESST